MKNNGLSDCSTIFVRKALTYLSKHADLSQPEQVKTYIANLQCGNGYKHNLALAYDKYTDYCQIVWQPPIYRRKAKAIKVPTKAQVESLIASTGKILSVKLAISKETGVRPIELCSLKVRDIDLERRTIYPTTAKYGAPRKLKISESLQASIKNHIERKHLEPSDKLFRGSSDYYGKKYRIARNKLADKLNKPELRTIRLYDFRHYFATMLYAKTRDILLVMRQLGHKKIETTLIYTHLIELSEDEWTCRTSMDVKQDKDLIENGFTFVTDRDGYKLFRKRK